HDIIMLRIASRIGDKRLLRIIRRYLQADRRQDGVRVTRDEGTPQGGPLSPRLANLLLDDLDQELERRGHYFCRYADDCNIYVQSLTAGQRVMESVTRFLEEKLRLRVNRLKSAVAPVGERKFLGHRLLLNGKLGIASKSIQRAKEKIRQITRRNRGVSLARVIVELNLFLVGWMIYYRNAACRFDLQCLDEWFGESCAAIVSNNASAGSPSLASSSTWALRRRSPIAWLLPLKAGGVFRWLARSIRRCRRTGSQHRASHLWLTSMTRYNIRRNRRIRQVRTV